MPYLQRKWRQLLDPARIFRVPRLRRGTSRFLHPRISWSRSDGGRIMKGFFLLTKFGKDNISYTSRDRLVIYSKYWHFLALLTLVFASRAVVKRHGELKRDAQIACWPLETMGGRSHVELKIGQWSRGRRAKNSRVPFCLIKKRLNWIIQLSCVVMPTETRVSIDAYDLFSRPSSQLEIGFPCLTR